MLVIRDGNHHGTCVGYVTKLSMFVTDCLMEKLFQVWLARAQLRSIPAKYVLKTSDAAPHCPFHVSDSGSGIEIVVYVHVLCDGRERSIRGAWHARIVLIGSCLGKPKFWRRRWREFDVIDVLREVRDRMISLC